MVLHVFISLLGGVPLCIPYGLYSGTSLGETTRGTLEGYPGRVLSVYLYFFQELKLCYYVHNYFFQFYNINMRDQKVNEKRKYEIKLCFV